MYLRLGRLSRVHIFDIVSLAATRESKTHSIGHLESIHEDSSLDSQLGSLSMVEIDANTHIENIKHMNMYHPHMDKDKGPATSQSSHELDYNTKLGFDDTNVHGVEIYHDPMG